MGSMMDALKGAIGMQPDQTPQQIDSDGKKMTFVPGNNGNLTVNDKAEPKPLYTPREPVAKTIAPKKLVEVGSSRG